MTRTGVVMLFVIAGLVLAGLAGCYHWLRGTQSRQERVIATAVSPDGKWRANVVEVLADSGGLSLEMWDDVDLASAHDPHIREHMLWMDAIGMGGAAPRILWTSPKKLAVTVPNISDIKLERTEFSSVQIDLHFDPPDPAARKAWLKKYFPDYHGP